ncbi:MAG TPA: hypothetical protein VK425_01060 [Acidimicrobiales bacterium]|nr:hypothetical protein [Acidimicrobiales bacterium]
MLRHQKALVIAAGAGLAATVCSATAAYATLPAGTRVTAALAKGTKLVFEVDIDTLAMTAACTSFSFSAVIPKTASGSIRLRVPPTTQGCTDSLGGTDAITANQANGKWILSVTKSSPYRLTLSIPKAGLTFESSFLSGCRVTAAPNRRVRLTGSYDGTYTEFTLAPVPIMATGCTSGAIATVTVTEVFNPSPGEPPF